jgi:hypothetical protein
MCRMPLLLHERERGEARPPACLPLRLRWSVSFAILPPPPGLRAPSQAGNCLASLLLGQLTACLPARQPGWLEIRIKTCSFRQASLVRQPDRHAGLPSCLLLSNGYEFSKVGINKSPGSGDRAPSFLFSCFDPPPSPLPPAAAAAAAAAASSSIRRIWSGQQKDRRSSVAPSPLPPAAAAQQTIRQTYDDQSP